MTVRAIAKLMVEYGAVWSGAVARGRARHRNEVLVLAYHNIVPHGERRSGDRSLHLSQRDFADQLDLLLETHDVVPLDSAFAPPSTPAESASRPRAVITFDDAYRGAMTAGVDELRTRDLPATVFVAPAFVNGGDFWWDVLTPSGADGLDPALRNAALTTCAGQDATIREWARGHGVTCTSVAPHMTCANEAELRSAVTRARLTVGSHSWSHPNLAALDTETLTRELVSSREWILSRFEEQWVDAISYPYGRESVTVHAATRATGYAYGFLITGGFTTVTPENPAGIARLNVPAGVSRNGFTMRAAGLVSD